MKYTDGNEINIGDVVEVSDGIEGKVVFSIDTNEYSSEFPSDEWEYLEQGIMIMLADGTLIHYSSNDSGEEFKLKDNNT